MYFITLGSLSFDIPILWVLSILLSYILTVIAIPLLVRDISRYVAQRKALEHRPELHRVTLNVLLCVIVILIGLNVMPQSHYHGHDLLNTCYGWPYYILKYSHDPYHYTHKPSTYEQLVSSGLLLLFINAIHWGLITVVTVGGAEWLTRLKSKSH